MKVQLKDVPQGHSVIDRTEPEESFDLGDWISLRSGLRVHLDVDRREHQITFRGRVEGEAEDSCGRCLKPVVTRIESTFLVLADRRGSDEPDDEVALEQEGSVIYHDGLEVDLGPSIREAIIVEVPQVVLCRPDCRGLCPICGKDRNVAPCACNPDQGDPRWAALDSLKKKNSETNP